MRACRKGKNLGRYGGRSWWLEGENVREREAFLSLFPLFPSIFLIFFFSFHFFLFFYFLSLSLSLSPLLASSLVALGPPRPLGSRSGKKVWSKARYLACGQSFRRRLVSSPRHSPTLPLLTYYQLFLFLSQETKDLLSPPFFSCTTRRRTNEVSGNEWRFFVRRNRRGFAFPFDEDTRIIIQAT